jgi:malonate decarboxylase beta subunit
MPKSESPGHVTSRGQRWLEAIVGNRARCSSSPSIIYGDSEVHGLPFRAIAVVPNADCDFVRARNGEFGVAEGWELARCIDLVTKRSSDGNRCALLAVVDVPGQTFGRREEMLGLHIALAASVDAYATARILGNPVVALVVGKAISGAFLAHGLQAGRILALDSDQVEVHVMSRASVARVTCRTVEEVKQLEHQVPATARDVHSFASLGGIDKFISCRSVEYPDPSEIELLRQELWNSFEELRRVPSEPVDRLEHPAAINGRMATRFVREKLRTQWDSEPTT